MSSTRKPPHCILHIGMHKTGSSSIQNTLAKQLPSSEFEYLKLGAEANHSTFIYNLFSDHPELYHCNIQQGLNKNQVIDNNTHNIEVLKAALNSTQADIIIISGEDISLLNENEICKLKDFLAKYCRSIQVIGYVRPPIAYMQSLYQQLVRGGNTNVRIENLIPSYRKTFENFDKVFGNKNTLLLKYDSSSLLNKDAVLDFCHHVGITVSPESVTRDNESISLEALSLLYVYHKLGFGYGSFIEADRENHLLINAVSRIGNKKIRFSARLSKLLLEKNLEDIHWMEARLGCSLDEALEDSEDSISSEDDFIALSTRYADELKQLLFYQIQQQPVTAQKIADWIHLLRQQLSSTQRQVSIAFSASQINQLKSENLQLSDALKALILSLGRAGHKEAATNVSSKLISFIQDENKNTHNDEVKITFSIDLYDNGCMMGWILDKSNPLHRLTIELRCIHGIIGKGVADQFRQDLANGEVGDGQCAFKIELDPKIKDFGDQIIIRVIDYNQDFFVKTSSIKGMNS